ncbi:MAG TPA: Ig-like domain-containing protein [Candidatus Dormibacteraeota bacterium]|jgi:hypothetical protein
MSPYRDPELDDVLQDDELMRIAELLHSARLPEPPLDDAFRSALRRQLMQKAWGPSERGVPWWRKAFAPPALAWASATVGVVLIASLVVFMSTQPPSGTLEIEIQSPVADSSSVKLSQPILVAFNQAMDHPSTEAAVQITPATKVGFSWRANTLAVQPTSGNLAPNTQYQVTIGPGAKTASGQLLAEPKTITFVTQPTKPATQPTPSPTASPNTLPGGLVRLAPIPQGVFYTPQWSADSSTLYFVGAVGALQSVPAKGGDVKVLVPDSVSLPAISPAGDRIAYVRGGKLVILTFADNTTTELTVTSAPTAVAWVKDQLLVGTRDGVYSETPDGPVKLATLEGPNEATAVISIAPDGAHAAFASAMSLFILDVATGKTHNLGGVGAGTTFQGWAPDGSRVLYNGVIADLEGHTVATLPGGDPSWSAQNEILLGSDTELTEVRPDGSGLIKLADGTYHNPIWAPNSTSFAFLRGQALWASSAPAPQPLPSAVDAASARVTAFMEARLRNDSVGASAFLDADGKAAYGEGGPALIPDKDAGFKRFYILTAQPDASAPNTVRVVVRLVFGHGKNEKALVEETLTLRRQLSIDPFLIHGARAGKERELGKGAEVVAIDVQASTVKITFDSDLTPDTVAGGVVLTDSKGKQVGDTPTYANRTVTITGLQLTPGDTYRLQVLTSVQDVHGKGVASEYNLDLIGPGASNASGNHRDDGATPSPMPAPGTPSPAPQD